MKPNVIIINTGRGALIDTHPTIHALKHKKIGGLGIDVYEQEEKVFFQDLSGEIMKDDDLAKLLMYPNVLVTGHQAYFTEEALNAIYSITINNINEFSETGNCKNEIKPPKE